MSKCGRISAITAFPTTHSMTKAIRALVVSHAHGLSNRTKIHEVADGGGKVRKHGNVAFMSRTSEDVLMMSFWLPFHTVGGGSQQPNEKRADTAVQHAEDAALEEGHQRACRKKIFPSYFHWLGVFSHGFDFHVRLGERIVVTEEKTVSCNVSGVMTACFSGLNLVPFADRESVRVLGKCLWAGLVYGVSRVVLLLNSQLVCRCFASGVGVPRTVRNACDQWMGFLALNALVNEAFAPLMNASKEGDA